MLSRKLTVKHDANGHPQPNIFTDLCRQGLAKAGICFTFPAHKVRITPRSAAGSQETRPGNSVAD
ncbi:hypothetical protein C7G83_17565 [Siccibacter turicensis]|uniref:Uncharacterized protein n=1 Tax=Siccibacter turicensis TaxID=357233 RepID=A0A2P8VFV7_9ENTR|nr:hypothetical protein C7G83_17565 [Siccibacter turicensis]